MIYTDEHIAYIRETLPGVPFADAHKMFCERFGVDISLQQYRSACKNRKIGNGRVTRFEKGKPSYNKGKKVSAEVYEKMAPTMFKKGMKPHNYLPVGSEVINSDGYWVVKVGDPHHWEFKHKLLWRQKNGDIPKGSCIIFKDSDRLNCTIDNLMLVSKGELSELNRQHLISEVPEFTEIGLTIAKISRATRKKRR